MPKGRTIEACDLQLALEKGLGTMARIATNGYYEKWPLFSPTWYIKPVKILRLERMYETTGESSRNVDVQVIQIMRAEIESLEGWWSWFLSFVPRSKTKRLWTKVEKNLRPKVNDRDVLKAMLPLWSTLRRMAMLAELFGANTEVEAVQAEMLMCLVEKSAAIRRMDAKMTTLAAAGQMVGECLIRDLKDDVEAREGGVEEGITMVLNVEKLRIRLGAADFKRRALRNAKDHFKCRCLEEEGDKLWLQSQKVGLTDDQRRRYVISAQTKYEEAGLSQKVQKIKAELAELEARTKDV